MNLAPVVKRGPQYTDEERAIIAGYLLQMRQGTLSAVNSTARAAQLQLKSGLEKEVVYYRNAEAYSRFLLYWVGYEVFRNKMYYGETQTINP